MPLYKFLKQTQGPEVYAAGHVYDISHGYAEALNSEGRGPVCERWDPEKERAELAAAAAAAAGGEPPAEAEVHAKTTEAPLLKGDAWRARGEHKKRIGTGV